MLLNRERYLTRMKSGWFFEDKIQPPGTGNIKPENAYEWMKYYKIKPKN